MFNINTYAIVFGAILTHPNDDHMDHPNAYTIQKLNKAKLNYSTTERKGLKMIFALQIFHHYLLENPFIFYTNHQALKYLVNKPLHHGQVCHWFILFQEFEF